MYTPIDLIPMKCLESLRLQPLRMAPIRLAMIPMKSKYGLVAFEMDTSSKRPESIRLDSILLEPTFWIRHFFNLATKHLSGRGSGRLHHLNHG